MAAERRFAIYPERSHRWRIGGRNRETRPARLGPPAIVDGHGRSPLAVGVAARRLLTSLRAHGDITRRTDAAHDHDHPPAGHRPGLPAAQEPGRVQAFDLPFGQAHVFYPEADEERCTAALLVEVDPVGLVRGAPGHGADGAPGRSLAVRQRPALRRLVVPERRHGQGVPHRAGGRVPRAARAAGGRCRWRCACRRCPAAAARTCCAGCSSRSARRSRRRAARLDERFPEWGDSRYLDRHADAATARVADLLSHLYVLLPVLDDDKHYWVGDDEIEKLLRPARAGWPPTPSGS